MRRLVSNLAMSLLLLYGPAQVFAQQDHDDHGEKSRGRDRDERNRSDDRNRGDDRNAQRGEARGREDARTSAPPENRGYAVPQRSEREARDWQRRRGWQNQGSWQGRNSWRDSRSPQWRDEHRTWSQRGGYGGYYIPEARFRQTFGPQHMFRLRSRPVIVGGYPRFQYGGFWFMLADPFPQDWPDDWYARDDLYVDYEGDGYYLHDRRDPGISIAVSVVF